MQIGSLDGVTDGSVPDPLLLSYGLPIEGPNQTTYPLQVSFQIITETRQGIRLSSFSPRLTNANRVSLRPFRALMLY